MSTLTTCVVDRDGPTPAELEESAFVTRAAVVAAREAEQMAFNTRADTSFMTPEWDAATSVYEAAQAACRAAEWVNSAAWARHRTVTEVAAIRTRCAPAPTGDELVLTEADLSPVVFLAALSETGDPQRTGDWLFAQGGTTEALLGMIVEIISQLVSDYSAASVTQLPAPEQVIALGDITNIIGRSRLTSETTRRINMYERALIQDENSLAKEKRRRSRYDQNTVDMIQSMIESHQARLVHLKRALNALSVV